jgi:CheY-like chemotaxis protein
MTTSPRTVLVVDDDAMMGELMAAIIDSADYQTVLAANGRQGVHLAQTVAPAVVFCDLSMPGMNGEDVIRSLRADPRTAHIPLVLMTGHAPNDAHQFGADAFLQKPFCVDELLPLLNSVLRLHDECLAKAC